MANFSLNLPGSNGSSYNSAGQYSSTAPRSSSGYTNQNTPAPPPVAPVPAPPTPVNPYAGLTSNLQGLSNPFDVKFRDAAINQNRGAVQGEFDNRRNNIGADAASRGLNQGGMSGIEQQLAAENDMARNSTLGQVNANAETARIAGNADFESKRATGLDAFATTKASGDAQFGRDIYNQYLSNAKLPGELTGQNLTNQRTQQTITQADQMMPGELKHQQLTNDQISQAVEQTKTLFPGVQEQAEINLALSHMDLSQKQELAKWIKDNPWAGPVEAAGKVAAILGPTAAVVLQHFLPAAPAAAIPAAAHAAALPAGGGGGGGAVAESANGFNGSPMTNLALLSLMRGDGSSATVAGSTRGGQSGYSQGVNGFVNRNPFNPAYYG